MRIYNFNPGPAMLPRTVMEKARDEFLNYKNTGCGIMELSHRGKEFTEVIERAEANIKKLMSIGDDYSVLFLQGGASLQFAMLPMNLMRKDGFADYADTGFWASKAIEQAKLYGEVKTIASSKPTNYDRIPEIRHWKPSNNASYLHITTNNTIFGTQYHSFPDVSPSVPLVADMSSDILSRVMDFKKFGLVYAGAQKNLGPSGITVVVMRKDLANLCPANLPVMMKYSTHIENKSLYNTPPTFGVYLVALVTDWILHDIGGLAKMEEINDAKSEAIYENIDADGFYSSPVDAASRSKMNVVFKMPKPELDDLFVKEAEKHGLIGLKGHRSTGGIRASIYNAMPLEGVELLIDFMNDFESQYG